MRQANVVVWVKITEAEDDIVLHTSLGQLKTLKIGSARKNGPLCSLSSLAFRALEKVP